MQIVGLTGIGMANGVEVLSFDGGAMLATVLMASLLVSAAGILLSRIDWTWTRSRAFRPALRLHPSAAGGR
jgi:hypothetical protein